MTRESLKELARKYGTDKGEDHHNYVSIYDSLMSPARDSSTKILEIGVQYGSSIKMWLDYFKNATIFGIDNDVSVSGRIKDSRFRLIFGNERSEDTWAQIPSGLDFVIDDGSHFPDYQIFSFTNNFHKVKPGGFWIIEDTHCSFHQNFSNDFNLLYPWVEKLMVKMQMIPEGIMTGNFYLERQKSEYLLDSLSRIIYGIRVYKSVIIFERAND